MKPTSRLETLKGSLETPKENVGEMIESYASKETDKGPEGSLSTKERLRLGSIGIPERLGRGTTVHGRKNTKKDR